VLASSASGEELDHHADILEAKSILTATTSKDDVEHSKPCPDIFAKALEKSGCVSPDDAIVVGDTPYDITAAGQIGVPAVAVRSGGFSDAQLAGAVAIYDDVAALLADYDSSPLGR
jgi:membrane protein